MKAVIPLGARRPATLPYVLRSLAENAGVTQVVTVGEHPEGIEPDLHIDSPNDAKPHVNVAGHLRRAAETLGGSFIWIDDDTFLMAPWVPGVYVRRHSIADMLRWFPNKGAWSAAVRASIAVMVSQGYDPVKVPCGTIHRPWLVDSKRALRTLDALDAVGGGSFKALYCAGLPGVIEADDAKVLGRQMPDPQADVISVVAQSWQTNAGRIVRERFVEPSRWESTPTTDTAQSTSGPARAHHNRRRR